MEEKRKQSVVSNVVELEDYQVELLNYVCTFKAISEIVTQHPDCNADRNSCITPTANLGR